MDKSMLKKMYSEMSDDDPSSAVNDAMSSSDESLDKPTAAYKAKQAFKGRIE